MNHEEIRDLIPDYLGGRLEEPVRRELEDHLRNCTMCSEEVSTLQTMINDPVPDPGDLYWSALPQRAVARAAEKDRKTLWPAPLFSWRFSSALAMVLLVAGLFFFMKREPGIDQTDYIGDPLEFTYIEYHDLPVKEMHMPIITEQVAGDDVPLDGGHLLSYSYQEEIAMMSDKELEALTTLINTYSENGG